MLQTVLESARIAPETCAGLIGVDRQTFGKWLRGEQPIPETFARMLATMLGVACEALQPSSGTAGTAGDLTPAIWFKLRDPRLAERDREYVALIRQLAYYVDQLEQASGSPSRVWERVFEMVRHETDGQAPPREQGRQAARLLRAERGLGHGATGIGTVIRGHLRTMGVLVVETPLRGSKMEGCSFYVRSVGATAPRPCIFANTHSSTWFRRNSVLLHELAHDIFDAPSAGASVDYKNDSHDVGCEGGDDLSEQRAEAFAQEMLVPREVLKTVATRLAVRWDDVRPVDMAQLVAETHAEQRLVVRAAADAGFLDAAGAEHCAKLDIAEELPRATERALGAIEFFQRYPEKREWMEKRTTTLPAVPLRLPVGYVKSVVDAVNAGTITWSKGAELLMIDRHTYMQRFGELLPPE